MRREHGSGFRNRFGALFCFIIEERKSMKLLGAVVERL